MNTLVKNPVTLAKRFSVMSDVVQLSKMQELCSIICPSKKNHDLPMIHSFNQSQRERQINYQGVNELDVHCTRNKILS